MPIPAVVAFAVKAVVTEVAMDVVKDKMMGDNGDGGKGPLGDLIPDMPTPGGGASNAEV